jgi:glycosyltransferase involved in cell wall biosynthesis
VTLRVLHLRDSPWIDGPGRTILETATHVDRATVDYHVGVFVDGAGGTHPLLREVRRRHLPVHEIVDDGSSMLKVVNRVVALIDQCEIGVLHSSEFRSNIVALLCRMRRPVLLVSTAHGWICNDARGTIKSILDRFVLRWFDRVIFVSKATRRRVPRWWLPDRRARILHNALVAKRFAPGAKLRSPIRHPQHPVRLLNIGRLSREKGQDLLIRAFAALVQEGHDLHLNIAGAGPLEGELHALAATLGVTDRVCFLGFRDDLTDAYLNADLVVQSSSTEGLPNVILEAAHLGTPIVATDVGGTAEIIAHGVSGWLVKPRSSDELANGIRYFLREPAAFAAMSEVARTTVDARFSLELRTGRQMEIYSELAGGRA